MAETGATLQCTNNELVKCIEDLREKREEANRFSFAFYLCLHY